MGNEHVRLGIVRKIKFHIVIKWNNTKPVIRERPVRKCGSPKHTTKKKKTTQRDLHQELQDSKFGAI